MAKVLVVTSGKGGVGKTTSTAALGAALAQTGEKVVVIDFDVGLRNLDLVMGAERRVVFDLINVVQGVAKLSQALIRDKRLESLWLLPASQTRDKDALTQPKPRAQFKTLTDEGWLDAIRAKHPGTRIYTYWDYKWNRWEKDGGLRLDHLLLNSQLQRRLRSAGVDKWVRGEEGASDHAPAWIKLGRRSKAG